ncbi:(d)CMP kinase [Blattabacterium cuenoti]|uniref:(d)CMP kinase n=1 Tax=Blattabacterium cuenoti TaxID=1653831 RepID=UPI00163C33F4|nr:(d)CMP kinase [Blattabacterium cuenoti]
MNKKISIAIDGFSSSGKSSLAKKLSKKLGYSYIDTGAMYRSITLLAIRNKVFNSDLWNIQNFLPILKNINLQFKWNEITNQTEIFLNEENIQSEIRSVEVSDKVSFLARIPEIREKLMIIQKKFVNQKGIIMEGRDIGYKILPKSELKIFMRGSIDVRSYRRYQDYQKQGKKISYENVKKNLLYRDNMDLSRKISPLKQSINSVEIDNTYENIEKQINFILKFYNKIMYETLKW